jgi:hypothetical protein
MTVVLVIVVVVINVSVDASDVDCTESGGVFGTMPAQEVNVSRIAMKIETDKNNCFVILMPNIILRVEIKGQGISLYVSRNIREKG